MREFGGDRRELGVTDVARRLGISTSSAFRLLTTLTEERLLERGGSGARYRLAMTMYELGTTVFPHTGLHEAAMPVLANVRHGTGEAVRSPFWIIWKWCSSSVGRALGHSAT